MLLKLFVLLFPLFTFAAYTPTTTVSGTVQVGNFPASQAVTGTFWQATQPISGSVSVLNFPASQAVTGTFYQATQPVSLASIPLATGAATSAWQQSSDNSLTSLVAKDYATQTTLSALNTKIPSNLTVTATRLLTDGSGVTQPVSAASLPLPAGASTSAWQISLDNSVNTLLKPASTLAAVTTVGTITNPVTVNAHAVTNAGTFAVQSAQSGLWNVSLTSETTKVIGTVNIAASQSITANAGTSLNTSALALSATQTDGTQKSIVRGGAKGSTAAADLTSTPQSADRQALDVQIRTSAGVPVDTFGGGTQYASGTTRGTSTGTLMMVDDGTNIRSALGTVAGVLKVDFSSTALTNTSIVKAQLQDNTGSGWTFGQKSMSSSMPITIASDQTALPVSQDTTILQGSTTSGQKGALVFGAVTSGAPTYTTAQSSPLSLDILGNLRTRATVSGTVDVNQIQMNGVAISTGNGVVGTGVQRVAIASDNTAFSVNATPPTLTKGTQGATGYSVQALKDAGRNQTNYFMISQVISTAGEVLQSLTGYKSGAAVTATTTPAVVTTGKTYRITQVVISYVATATVGTIAINLRANTAGLASLTSPIVASWSVGESSATAGFTNTVTIPFPDGLEFAAGTGIVVSVQGINATGGAGAIVGYAKIAVMGYEY